MKEQNNTDSADTDFDEKSKSKTTETLIGCLVTIVVLIGVGLLCNVLKSWDNNNLKTETESTGKTHQLYPPVEIIKKTLESKAKKIRAIGPNGSNTLQMEIDVYGNRINASSDTFILLKALKEMELGYEKYRIVAHTNLVDKYGNKENDIISSLVYSKETINRINFDNVNQSEILELADDGMIDPVLK